MQGRLAGVDIVSNNARPGTAGQIRIRGNRSLAASQGAFDQQNSPLLVLDGIPFSGAITDINPDDIQNIDVLKDASATAIYGSRGSNGVIIITTKRGRTGKALLSYNGYYGIGNPIGKYSFMNAQEYVAFKEQARLGAATPTNPNPAHPYPFTVAEQAGTTAGTNTDWQDVLYQQSYITSHEINLSGGTEATQFGMGGGYFKETAVIPGASFERFSLRTTLDHRLNSRIKVGINSINTLSYTNGEGLNPFYNTVRLSPLLSPYNPDGTVNLFPNIGSGSDPTLVNPLTIRDNEEAIKSQRRRLRTFNSLYGEVQIINDLKYRINVGLDYRQDQTGSYLGPNTLYNPGTNNPNTLGSSITSGNISTGNAEAWTYLIENLLTYEKRFKEKHRVTFTGLFSVQKDHSQGNSFNAIGIPADYIQEYNLNLASGNLIANPGSFAERGLLSYMGRLNYVYNDRYLLTATVRRDGSSVLSPGNQWFTYPAVAVGWNMMNEDFMSAVPVFSNLKLRGGWGITSNQSINPYTTLGTLATNFYNFGSQNVTGYFVPTVPNPSLQWESTSNWNIGLDFGLLRNRITGTIDVYDQQTKDILLQKSLPRSTGTTSTIINAGRTAGHGFEFSLSSVNIQSKNGFSWSTDLNFSVIREKIIQLQDPTLLADINNGWFVGQPMNVIYDVQKTGIWQTADSALARSYGMRPGQIRVADVDGATRDGKPDGRIDANDRQIIGNFQPDWVGGLTNRFSYKGVDLSIVMFARMGQMVVLPYLSTTGGAEGYPFFNNSRVNSLRRDYWTPENPSNEFPRPDASADNVLYSSTLAYRDGSFVKCRSINLGYNVPSQHLQRFGLNSLRVYVSAVNPFIIYSPLVRDNLALDPEGNGYGGSVGSATGAPAVPGRAITVNLNIPTTRQFLFGLNLKF